jgi:hemerythrin-like metal-binding protein
VWLARLGFCIQIAIEIGIDFDSLNVGFRHAHPTSLCRLFLNGPESSAEAIATGLSGCRQSGDRQGLTVRIEACAAKTDNAQVGVRARRTLFHPTPPRQASMKDLVWDKTLSVDVPEIDEDHRRLVDLYNLLKHAVADGEPKDYIAALTEELIACTAWHFRHEERLMLKYRYDGVAAHKAEHEELIDSGKELQQKLLAPGKPVSSDEIQRLEHWLVGHILGTDMDLGAYLAQEM